MGVSAVRTGTAVGVGVLVGATDSILGETTASSRPT